MAAAVQIMHSSTLIAATYPDSSPTTATVREHACLFTHDLRRKQKRWQDGRLKYHTFNRRVMVYDERGNFVGDTHWREDYDLADGDELELERGGIIIQVGECVGSRDQDLSELVDKRAQERAQRQAAAAAAAAARRPSTTPITSRHVARPQPLLQRHLHDVIGTPSGHHGRAVVPRESPYEERQQRQTPLQSDDTRPAKRRRRDISPLSKSGYARNLFGATLTLSGRPLSQVPARHRQYKTSQSREEIASPPSSNPSNDNDFPSAATKIAQTPRNADSYPSRQMPLQTEDVRPHSSIKPGLPPYSSLDVLEEPAEAPAPQKKQSKLTVNERKDIVRRHSVLDSVSTNRNLGKLRGLDKAHEQADLNTDRPDELPTVRASKKIHDKGKLRAINNCIPGHRPQDPTIIDPTDNPANQHQNQPVLDEPRTELRIKPRKKRGLLMISERHTKCAASSESETVKIRPDAHSRPLPSKAQPSRAHSDNGSKKVRSTNTRHKQIDLPKETQKFTSQRNRIDECGDDHDHDKYNDEEGYRQLLHTETARYSAEDEEEDEVQCLDRPRSNSQKEARLSSAVGQSDIEMAETCAIETGRRLRPRKRLPTDDDSFSNAADGDYGRLPSARREDNTAVDDMPAPRLAKLGRKSIKSREVIGFMFDEESDTTPSVKQNYQAQEEPALNPSPEQTVDDDHHKLKGKIGDGPASTEARLDIESQSRRKTLLAGKEFTALQRQNNRKPRSPDSEGSLTVQIEEAPSAATATAEKQPIPPITNPATRGRKAAKPSDAAGQMPVCPLSVEPAGSSSLNQVFRNPNVQGNLGKGSTNPMPGFSRANGGPWSREAHDLFDFKRPS
ncbi:hypothetical protein F4803DRAFT_499993 [Xylaria telfairii]|nr:hypothetical protein F4803DRAFT_499993 [Xylaria telfairii]